ncbi:hypothetical protein KFL_006410020 [Klebsormidium nitens]|uniref:Glycosyl transferase CAP10 domain-containing protein n=1 Tax=Klebsormidium nitens TaxID=105231 RepID=A0A1Y1IID1_KLENI|nr:hypothetical protein KFL_006410020 [Klebsormidium nitens]|eukprot:GAQ90453.1 hypothetical protein KFL_006410020 [Klebsormidium nitens]
MVLLALFGKFGALSSSQELLSVAFGDPAKFILPCNSSAPCKQSVAWAGFDEASRNLARDAREALGVWRKRGGFSTQQVEDALVTCRQRLTHAACTRFAVQNGTLVILSSAGHPFEQVWVDQLMYLNERHGLPEHLDFVIHYADNPVMSITDPEAPIFASNTHVDRIDVGLPGFCRDQFDLTGSKAARARHPWRERKNMVVWRGTCTGGYPTLETWRDFPRVKLANFTSNYPEYFDVKLVKACTGCPEENVYDEMAKFIPTTDVHMSREELRTYRMILDIDGNAFSNRLRWMTKENFLIFKVQTPHSEYFTKYFRDGEHLYEVKSDFSDLVEKVQYALEHEEKTLAMLEAAARQSHLYLGRGMWEFYSLALFHEYMELFNRTGVT